MRRLTIPALFVAVALVQTAPLVLHLTTHVPFGNYPTATTVRWEMWTLWWNSDRLTHGYLDYWHAPIFHPNPAAFAYSEPQWLTGLAFGVALLLADSPPLAYNAILLAILALNGWSGFFLLRQLGLSLGTALAGGVLVEMLPLAADQLGVVQTVVLFPCIMVLACLVQFRRDGGAGPLLRCGVWMAVCFHTASHTALLFGPVAVAGYFVLCWPPRRFLAPIAALGLCGALVAPIAIGQLRVLSELDMERYRSAETIRRTSARVEDYLQMPATNWLRQRPPDWRGHALGFGVAVWPVALAGIWFGLASRCYRRWTLCCLGAALSCVLLSFGPSLDAPWRAPYELLRTCYPGFESARNLWRFAGLAQLFVVLLAALGLAWLGRRRWAQCLVVLVVAVDWLSAPVPLLKWEVPAQEWVQWLRESPLDTRIVHVPMVASGRADRFDRTTYWMNCQMYHGRPMANGFASFVPRHVQALSHIMAEFPSASSISALRRLQISHVLVESDWFAERAEQFEVWGEHLALEKVTADVRIYRVVSSGDAKEAVAN